MLFRKFILLPLIVLYALTLFLAALPGEIRPAFLDVPSEAAYKTLSSVGIHAGMAVFGGSVEELVGAVRSRCIVVTGTDSTGEQFSIHPIEPCPTRGFRWKPEIYHHMVYHWVWQITANPRKWNLWAMGDHFCQSSPDHQFQHVTIKRVVGWVNYETGLETSLTSLVGRVKCRP